MGDLLCFVEVMFWLNLLVGLGVVTVRWLDERLDRLWDRYSSKAYELGWRLRYGQAPPSDVASSAPGFYGPSTPAALPPSPSPGAGSIDVGALPPRPVSPNTRTPSRHVSAGVPKPMPMPVPLAANKAADGRRCSTGGVESSGKWVRDEVQREAAGQVHGVLSVTVPAALTPREVGAFIDGVVRRAGPTATHVRIRRGSSEVMKDVGSCLRDRGYELRWSDVGRFEERGWVVTLR